MAQENEHGQGSVPEQKTAGRTYTQEEVDGIIGKVKGRLSEKSKNSEADIAQRAIETWKIENGLTDDVISEIQNRDAHKIEIVKREAEIKKLLKDKELVDSERDTYKSKYTELLTRSHIGSLASKLESNDPDLIYLILEKKLTIDGDGNVLMSDGSSVEDAVKKILTDKPHLRKSSISHGGGGASGGSGSLPSKEDLLTSEGRRAYLEKRGRFF